MKVILLAGGYGTRLGRLGEKLPKPLLPLTEEMRVLDYLVENLGKYFEEKDMIIVTNKKFEEKFREWAGNGFEGKIVVEPHEKDEEKFGTIKGLRYVLEKGKIDEDVLVIASDNVLYPFDSFLEEMLHEYEDGKAVLGVFEAGEEKIRGRFGNVKINGNYVEKFIEKPLNPISPYAAMAVYVFPHKFNGKRLEEVLDGYLSNGNPDAPGNFIAWLVSNGYEIKAVIFRGKWWDIGKVEDLKSAQEYFRNLKEENKERYDTSHPEG